jgi:hypothetical protein
MDLCEASEVGSDVGHFPERTSGTLPVGLPRAPAVAGVDPPLSSLEADEQDTTVVIADPDAGPADDAEGLEGLYQGVAVVRVTVHAATHEVDLAVFGREVRDERVDVPVEFGGHTVETGPSGLCITDFGAAMGTAKELFVPSSSASA